MGQRVFLQANKKILVDWVIAMAKAGFPVTKYTFMGSVARLANELGMEKTPGEKWYKLFRARNTRISNRIYQTLTRSRVNVTITNINKWFKEVHLYLEEKGLVSILDSPLRVFNANETAFYMNPKGSKVLGEKGSKSVYLAGANDEKENITVLMTVNAAGQTAPPMIVYRYKRIPLHISDTVPSEWAIGRSENGWITQEVFYMYMANFFQPWLIKENIKLPVLFFLDGIELIALYPNATHLMQPLDVAVFHSLKIKLRKRVQDWRISHTGDELKKKDFPPLLQEAIKETEPSIVQHGFRKCGLMPWNPQAIVLPLNTQITQPEQTEQLNIEKIKEFLTYLEEEIGEEKVTQFKNNQENWNGPEPDLSLYPIWKQNQNKLKPNQSKMKQNINDDFPVNSAFLPNNNQEIIIDNFTSSTEPIHAEEAGPSNCTVHSTPNKQTSSNNVQSPKAVTVPTIPSPFKRVLLWPEVQPTTSKRMKKEKISSVITSTQNMLY